MDLNALLAQYDYTHPDSAVALEPASPRDTARLLVLDPQQGIVAHDTFRNLTKHLPPKSLLVFNETKVIPARLEVSKPTGGKVRILFVEDHGKGTFLALADRPIDPGMILSITAETPWRKAPFFTVLKREASGWLMSAHGVRKPVDAFVAHGIMPLPPYLKKTTLTEKDIRTKYQTIFAKTSGSVAAPTASLHFTPRLMTALKRAGHEIVFVTLHVNLGTFAPLTEQHLKDGKLHQESYVIPSATFKAIARAKKEGRPVIAVGTTACRAIESSVIASEATAVPTNVGKQSQLQFTRLFIQPGYKYRTVDGLITNFHVPKSSLLMLVSALTGREFLLDAYKVAIAKGYKLFSFGDGMLILPQSRPSKVKLLNKKPV